MFHVKHFITFSRIALYKQNPYPQATPFAGLSG